MRHLIPLGFLTAALLLYGLSLGRLSAAIPMLAGALVLAGVTLEGAFWLRLVPRRRERNR